MAKRKQYFPHQSTSLAQLPKNSGKKKQRERGKEKQTHGEKYIFHEVLSSVNF